MAAKDITDFCLARYVFLEDSRTYGLPNDLRQNLQRCPPCFIFGDQVVASSEEGIAL